MSVAAMSAMERLAPPVRFHVAGLIFIHVVEKTPGTGLVYMTEWKRSRARVPPPVERRPLNRVVKVPLSVKE